MDVSAVEKVGAALSSMDKAVQEVVMQMSKLEERQQEEVTKIDNYVASSQSNLRSAAEVLRQQTGSRFSVVADELTSQRGQIEATKCELKELLDMAKRGDISQLEEGLHHLANRELPVVQLPVLHLIKSQSKLKASDVGYLQMAEFLPHEFNLQLDKVGLCTVTTTQQFTDRIQSSVKFNVKNKASKVPVTFVKEDCGLADDRKSFRLAFSAVQQGEYVVSVLLYDKHVVNSPLRFTVSADNEKKSQNNLSSVLNETSERSSRPYEADLETRDSSTTTHQEVTKPGACSPDYETKPRNDLPEQQTENQHPEKGSGFVSGSSYEQESETKADLTTSVDIKKSEPIDELIKEEIEADRNISSQGSEPALPVKSGTLICTSRETNNNYLLLDKGLQSVVLDFVGMADSGKLLWTRKASVGAGLAGELGGKILPTLNKPIGICLLQDKTIVVASTGEHQVKIFSPAGKLLGHVNPPERTFFRPSDLASLKSGQFVVRDNGRVQVFSSSGEHVRTLVQLQPRSDCSCYGLAEDGEGRLVTIQQASRGEKATDLLFFDTVSGEMVKKISMEDVIKDKHASKCRFLTFRKEKLYITDLGLDCVYTLDPRNGTAKVFGKTGTGPSCFSDPAGLVVDEMGNMVVADSKNHRLCLYTSQGKFHSEVRLSPEVRRPSGLLLDLSAKEMYVLNLHGRVAMVKYALGN